MQSFAETAMTEIRGGYWSFHWDSPRFLVSILVARIACGELLNFINPPQHFSVIWGKLDRAQVQRKIHHVGNVFDSPSTRTAGRKIHMYTYSLSLNMRKLPPVWMWGWLEKERVLILVSMLGGWWCRDHNNSAETLGSGPAARTEIGARVVCSWVDILHSGNTFKASLSMVSLPSPPTPNALWRCLCHWGPQSKLTSLQSLSQESLEWNCEN